MSDSEEDLRDDEFNADINTVKLLLDNGDSITGEDNRLLKVAANQGHADAVQLLIDNGADVNAGDNKALKNAAWNGHNDVILLLLNGRADVTAGDNRVLKNASWAGHADTVKLLIDNGADVTTGGNAVIKDAAWHGRDDIVQLLIDAALNHPQCRYAYHNRILYIIYVTDIGEGNLSGYQASIWCSSPDNADCEFLEGYLRGIGIKKSAA
jgi:ankyrin repeat protein